MEKIQQKKKLLILEKDKYGIIKHGERWVVMTNNYDYDQIMLFSMKLIFRTVIKSKFSELI